MSADAYIHKAIAGAPGAPLMFLFHGTGGDENQLVSLGQEMLPGVSIVSPRGDVSEYGAARFFRRTGEGVYDMDDLALRTGKMAAFVRAHVEAQKPSAVLGLGYSNGAHAPADPVRAAGEGQPHGKAYPDHRRPPRSDLPAQPHGAARRAFAVGRGRCHTPLA
jgi:phospholipase/carboxylesterase